MPDTLKTLFIELYGPPDSSGKLKKKMEHLAELGQLLAKEVRRESAWTSHHLNALIMGYKNFRMTADLEKAIEILLTKQRDPGSVHPLYGLTQDVIVRSINGYVQSGSIVTGKSIRCKGCLIWFVPHHNLQRYCCKECPQRPPKRKAKLERI